MNVSSILANLTSRLLQTNSTAISLVNTAQSAVLSGISSLIAVANASSEPAADTISGNTSDNVDLSQLQGRMLGSEDNDLELYLLLGLAYGGAIGGGFLIWCAINCVCSSLASDDNPNNVDDGVMGIELRQEQQIANASVA